MNNTNIFISYAHQDQALLKTLEAHLNTLKRQHVINIWHDRDINAGQRWRVEIDKHLQDAQIILLLISPDFIASDYSYSVEMKAAMDLYERGKALVIPIILRPVDWLGKTPLGKFQALPTGGIPVTSWKSQDEAFLNIVHGIRKVIEQLETDGSNAPGVGHVAATPLPRPKSLPSAANEERAIPTHDQMRLDSLATTVRRYAASIQDDEHDLRLSDAGAKKKFVQRQQRVMKDFLREYLERANELGTIVPTDIIQISARLSDTGSASDSSYDAIREALTTLSPRELRLLELDLDVDIDMFPGDDVASKIVPLLDYMRQNARVDELRAYLKRKRPLLFANQDAQ